MFIGLRSSKHVVLASVNKAVSDSLLTRERSLRSECINHSFVYASPLPVGRLVVQLADKAQVCTQRSWKRPYGVGLLVAGLDELGAHLYYNCPSGNYFEYQAFAIGSRSQAAKPTLRGKLIKHGLLAVKETLQGEKLTSSICTVVIVGVDEPFHKLNLHPLQELIDVLEAEEAGTSEPQREGDQSAMQEDRNPDVAPMDI
ncbi:hypothetical protein AMTR_s00002p00262700 [Amborella trichopoda]|uniref:Proteasome alpha-type subunits domain-containing protein n=1 Tax=Amborella trichopoda TaxID=13333 RepID=W1P0C4_AMBTC|nr:hypothetical protein AMTR_s00002p00262700 [Amborella trichopoda]